jgi:hypothetical protein
MTGHWRCELKPSRIPPCGLASAISPRSRPACIGLPTTHHAGRTCLTQTTFQRRQGSGPSGTSSPHKILFQGNSSGTYTRHLFIFPQKQMKKSEKQKDHLVYCFGTNAGEKCLLSLGDRIWFILYFCKTKIRLNRAVLPTRENPSQCHCRLILSHFKAIRCILITYLVILIKLILFHHIICTFLQLIFVLSFATGEPRRVLPWSPLC